MSTDWQVKEYLENTTDSSKRVRTTTIILVVITVLVFAGFLNSWHGQSWNLRRIQFRQGYTQALKNRISTLSAKSNMSSSLPDSELVTDRDSTIPEFKIQPPQCGFTTCEEIPFIDDPAQPSEARRKIYETYLDKKLECYSCAKNLSEKLLESAVKSYVENVYFIRVPFFGVAFDINDLAVIGGLSLIIVLIMLRLSLRNFIVSLRVTLKAARKANLRKEFYDILASRQLFAFPRLEDKQQGPYLGNTEKFWKKSKWKQFYNQVIRCLSWLVNKIKFYFWKIFIWTLRSKEEIKEIRLDSASSDKWWTSNPHPLLKRIPTWICLIPAMVYLLVVINDFWSFEIGIAVNPARTKWETVLSIIFLLIILSLGFWCVSKWIELDVLWENFEKEALLETDSMTNLQKSMLENSGKEPLERAPTVHAGSLPLSRRQKRTRAARKRKGMLISE